MESLATPCGAPAPWQMVILAFFDAQWLSIMTLWVSFGITRWFVVSEWPVHLKLVIYLFMTEGLGENLALLHPFLVQNWQDSVSFKR